MLVGIRGQVSPRAVMCLSHDSENTTQIYLASLDTTVVDKANKKILDLL